MRGKKTIASTREFAKAIMIFHFIIPQMIQLAANLFQWDEEDQFDALWFGSFNGVMILGDAIEASVSMLRGNDFFNLEIRHPLGVFIELLKGATHLDEITWTEFSDANDKVFQALTKGAGGITGIPFNKIYNMTRGVTKTVDNDVEEGFLLMLGYSPYAIKENRE